MKTIEEKEQSHSEQQAQAQLESIKAMVQALQDATIADEDREQALEDAHQAILDDALSVEVRSGWVEPGAFQQDRESYSSVKPEEFCILLCTGGPAVRLLGDLDENGEPDRVRLQHQDWGTSWQELITTGDDNAALLVYAQQFYFGE